MESMSRSRLPSKKSSSSNTYAGKTIYDDVFGGPPQFGVPTLSPRSEEYTEIFQSFHSSRASSIPVLDLPVVDTNDLPFDVRSSKFDYTEIFGGFNTLDFAVSYEELFSHSNAGDDSSDDDWTPAQSDSLSDGSEKNHCLSNADAHSHQSLDFSEQFSGFYDKINPEENEDILNHAIHINISQVANDVTRAAAEGKRLRKSVTQPSNSNLSMHSHKSDSTGQGKEAFVSVSNINLRTRPSQVPPPSRPPPPLTVTKGDYDGLGLKLKASKSYAFERMTGESSPPYFDVEIDGSSSAAASAAAMKDAVEKAEAKLRSAKELMERKKEVQSRMKLRLDSDLKHEKEESVMKKIDILTSPIEGEKLIKKSRERNHGEHKLSHVSCDREGTAAWSEGSDFYEVVGKEQIKEEKIFEIVKSGESGLQIKGVAETFVGHQEHGKKILASRGEVQHKTNVRTVNEAGEFQLKENQVDAKQKLKEANGNIKRNNSDWESKGTFKDEDYRRELQEAEESVEKLETKVKQQKEAPETEECEKKEKEAHEREEKEVCERREKEKKEKVACERREKEQWERREKEAREREANEKKQKEASEREENKTKQKEAYERDENEKKQKDVFVLETIKKPKLPSDVEQKEKNLTESVEKKEDESKQIKDFEGGLNERGPSGAYEGDDNMMRINGVCGEEDDKNSIKESQMRKDNEKRSQEACEIGERDTREEVFLEDRRVESQECTGKEESDWQVNPSQGRVTNEGKKWKESDKHERDGEKVETSQNALSCEEDRRSEKEVELVEGLNVRVEEKINSSGKVEFLHVNNSKKECNGVGQSYVDLENPNILAHKREEREKNIKGFNFSFYQKGSKDRLVKNVNEALAQEEREKEERSKREMERLRKIEEERENERLRRIEEERERENERLRKIEEERERENERLRKIEEELEREREREKDRMEVNRATLERANGEAKERVEREAVERATAEFRQRALAEAREKLEKATAEARLRAEQRAAVEKATTEARERAAEKVLRHSYSSSDLPGPQVGPSSGSRILHTSVSFGVESESAQRCKARLERHQRTAERAANALAEKNQRDLLAQREQAERSRLAENLDAEVKRWSSGKEGNLRALLSTLQYILGPDSGWQPLPLTEVITAVAVKKAYRKATLCVHPDKLQQRGATIHQKYICEKVFDLLKEAWNKFNSEER